MILDLDIKEYHKMEGISSTILKTLMISPAHLAYKLEHGFKYTKATALGDAIHAYLLQPERFADNYTYVTETYKVGEKKGELKLDEEGEPLTYLYGNEDVLDIKNEEYKKFQAMVKAYQSSPTAMNLISRAKYKECTFIYKDFKVRPDFITDDGWIVDIKTVGGMADKPSSPQNFCKDFFNYGYDIQMYMYYSIVKKEIPEIKGFKFMCLDAKCPSGVQIYTFVDGMSPWFSLGKIRFGQAMKLYREYMKNNEHKVYESDIADDLPLPWKAVIMLEENENNE